MLHMFMFVSTNKRDKCSIVTVLARTFERANKLVSKKFVDWGYKGKPQRLAV